MKRFALSAILSLFAAVPAFGQWQVSAAGGMRYFHMVERDSGGRRLVREQGWIPGVALSVSRTAGAWRIGLHGEHFQGSVDYDGRVQSGSPIASTTDTRQSRIAFELGHPLADRLEAIGGIEHELWHRRVHGGSTASGVTERYRSWRLLAGIDAGLPSWAATSGRLRFMLVAAQAERLEVQFDNRLFDDARFSTRPALGARLQLTLHPADYPKLSVGMELDWLRVRRSGDAALLKNGFTAGTVAQPEHVKSAVTLAVRYRF